MFVTFYIFQFSGWDNQGQPYLRARVVFIHFLKLCFDLQSRYIRTAVLDIEIGQQENTCRGFLEKTQVFFQERSQQCTLHSDLLESVEFERHTRLCSYWDSHIHSWMSVEVQNRHENYMYCLLWMKPKRMNHGERWGCVGPKSHCSEDKLGHVGTL